MAKGERGGCGDMILHAGRHACTYACMYITLNPMQQSLSVDATPPLGNPPNAARTTLQATRATLSRKLSRFFDLFHTYL